MDEIINHFFLNFSFNFLYQVFSNVRMSSFLIMHILVAIFKCSHPFSYYSFTHVFSIHFIDLQMSFSCRYSSAVHLCNNSQIKNHASYIYFQLQTRELWELQASSSKNLKHSFLAIETVLSPSPPPFSAEVSVYAIINTYAQLLNFYDYGKL